MGRIGEHNSWLNSQVQRTGHACGPDSSDVSATIPVPYKSAHEIDVKAAIVRGHLDLEKVLEEADSVTLTSGPQIISVYFSALKEELLQDDGRANPRNSLLIGPFAELLSSCNVAGNNAKQLVLSNKTSVLNLESGKRILEAINAYTTGEKQIIKQSQRHIHAPGLS